MFDPTAFLFDSDWGYICCHTSCDYVRGAPWRILYNPLRWQIGIGRGRPCPIVINRNGVAHRKVADLIYRVKKAMKP